jgi:hypothetical protein
LVTKLIRLPSNQTLVEMLRPRYQSTENKLNAAQASESKQSFKDRIYRDMYIYHLFKGNPKRAEREAGMTEQENMELLVMKYEEAINQPFKIKANREFLMLQKILLRDAQRSQVAGQSDLQHNCPLETVKTTKRIEVYDDELTYIGKQSQISTVQVSSEPHRNFFLVNMDSVVYKYDLVSKELLF